VPKRMILERGLQGKKHKGDGPLSKPPGKTCAVKLRHTEGENTKKKKKTQAKEHKKNLKVRSVVCNHEERKAQGARQKMGNHLGTRTWKEKGRSSLRTRKVVKIS